MVKELLFILGLEPGSFLATITIFGSFWILDLEAYLEVSDPETKKQEAPLGCL